MTIHQLMLRTATIACRRWPTTPMHHLLSRPNTAYRYRISSFASKTGDKDGTKDDEEDPFGLSDDSSQDGNLPPAFKRDPATGKLLLEEMPNEISPQQKRLLSLSAEERSEQILSKLEDEAANSDELDGEERRDALGERLLTEEKALNTLGRRPSTVEGETARPLSPDELRATEAFVKHETGDTPDFQDIFQDTNLFNGEQEAVKDWEGSNPDLDVSWMSSDNANEQLEDLLPTDFAPTKLVSRKQAKKIPKHILHHNNLPLLRRYMSPSGAIMPRSQTRLGAKDQRKIANLIKRARHLGLIPYIGQFKVEANGWVHEPDMNENKEWETELERRGLVTPKQRQTQVNKQDPSR